MRKRSLESNMQGWIENINSNNYAGGTRETCLKVLRDYQREYEANGFGEAMGKELTKELDVAIVEPDAAKLPQNDLSDPSRKAAFEEMKKRYQKMSVWKGIQRKIEGTSPDWDKIENNSTLDADYFDSQYKNGGRSK